MSPSSLLAVTLVAATALHAHAQEAAPSAQFDLKTAPIPIVTEPSAPAAERATATLDESLVPVSPALEAQRAHFRFNEPSFDVDELGTTWVRSNTYKAGFARDGASFVPFFGASAPRNYPVTWRMNDVRSSGVAVEFARDVDAQRTGDVVSYARGSVVEQYVIALDTIEQRFVFDELPTRGELSVVLDVATELVPVQDDAGIRYENELGHVRYGHAFVLDAAGKKLAIETRMDGSTLEFVVPASFVAEAELPLTIDPLAGTTSVDVDTGSDYNSDVAYDASTNKFFVVYELIFSGTDHDVFGRRYADGIFDGTVTIDSSTTDWRNPKVANNNWANYYMCVAQVGVAPDRVIRGRGVGALSLTATGTFEVSGAESGDKTNPDVGGDSSATGPRYFMAVYQREFSATDDDIHARRLDTNSTVGGTIFVENSGSTIDHTPSISKTCGALPSATQKWNIVWQHETSSTNSDIQGARILWDGTYTDSTFTVASTILDERAPTASESLNDSANGRPWLAGYTIVTANGDTDLRLRAFEGVVQQGTLDHTEIVNGGTTPTINEGQCSITTDGRQWMLAYTRSSGTFPNTDVDVLASTVFIVGNTLGVSENVIVSASSADNESRPRIASTFSSGNPYRAGISYDRYNGSDYDVYLRFYDSTINADLSSYCFGNAAVCPCGNGGAGNAGCRNSANPLGARLSASGNAFVTADSFVLQGTGMPPISPCLYFQGTVATNGGVGNVFGDGLRCASGTVRRLGVKANSGGASQYPGVGDVAIHTKGAIPAIGARRMYQVWYRDTATFCTPLGYNLSNAIEVVWLP